MIITNFLHNKTHTIHLPLLTLKTLLMVYFLHTLTILLLIIFLLRLQTVTPLVVITLFIKHHHRYFNFLITAPPFLLLCSIQGLIFHHFLHQYQITVHYHHHRFFNTLHLHHKIFIIVRFVTHNCFTIFKLHKKTNKVNNQYQIVMKQLIALQITKIMNI